MKKYVLTSLVMVLFNILFFASPGDCAALSINQAVARATENSSLLQIAAENERIAAADLSAARGKNGIAVSAKSTFNVNDINLAGRSTGNINTVTLSYPLYSGGINELTIASRQDAMQKSKINIRQSETLVRLNTVVAYYNALEAQKTVQVNQQSVDNYRAHLNNVQQLYIAGSNARIEILRSEVALSDAEQSLIKAQNSCDTAMSTLKNMVKVDSSEELILTDDFIYKAFPESMPFCLDYAQLHRKDLQEDQIAMTIAEKNVKIAQRAYMPTVDITVAGSWDKSALPSQDNHDYSAGAVMNWSIFDNNVTKSQIEAAKGALDIAAITYKEDKDTVNLSVRQAYLTMQEAEKRIASSRDAVKQAEETHYVAEEKYKAGAGIMLDIIDSQLALSTAQLNYISAQYDFARGKATLENVMGN